MERRHDRGRLGLQPGTGVRVGRPGPSIALEPAPIELVGSLEPIVLEPIVLDERRVGSDRDLGERVGEPG